MQLTEKQFGENLQKALEPYESKNKIYRFKLVPVHETNVTYNTVDDYYQRWMYGQSGLDIRTFSVSEAIQYLAHPHHNYPLWIILRLLEETDNTLLFELQFSMRIRKPSQLKFIETGHPPCMLESAYIRQKYVPLMEQFTRNEVSVKEFETTWLQLFKNEKVILSPPIFSLLDKLFSDIDLFCADQKLREEDDLNEDQLREATIQTLIKLNQIRPLPDNVIKPD